MRNPMKDPFIVRVETWAQEARLLEFGSQVEAEAEMERQLIAPDTAEVQIYLAGVLLRTEEVA